jgi:hypothetical protein
MPPWLLLGGVRTLRTLVVGLLSRVIARTNLALENLEGLAQALGERRELGCTEEKQDHDQNNETGPATKVSRH